MSTSLIITTFNSENYFEELYNTIPFKNIDEVIVVNGGNEYTRDKYDNCHWIQHDQVKYPAVARNDGLSYALEQGHENIFICEDDMLFKNENIFNEYINAKDETGIEYFIFPSYGWNAGTTHSGRTPIRKIEYPSGLILYAYSNMTNEFTYRSKKILEEVGLYNPYKYTFDVDWTYRASLSKRYCHFWNFFDISNSDDFIMNNPNATSRLDADGKRIERLGPDYELFKKTHGLYIQEIPKLSNHEVINKLREIYKNRNI